MIQFFAENVQIICDASTTNTKGRTWLDFRLLREKELNALLSLLTQTHSFIIQPWICSHRIAKNPSITNELHGLYGIEVRAKTSTRTRYFFRDDTKISVYVAFNKCRLLVCPRQHITYSLISYSILRIVSRPPFSETRQCYQCVFKQLFE